MLPSFSLEPKEEELAEGQRSEPKGGLGRGSAGWRGETEKSSQVSLDVTKLSCLEGDALTRRELLLARREGSELANGLR